MGLTYAAAILYGPIKAGQQLLFFLPQPKAAANHETRDNKMASFCRAAATVRAAARRARSPATSSFQAAKHPVAPPRLRRSFVAAAALASADSLMPLHSAVAAARLRSCIASDSSSWSCLSQGLPA
uniref:Uncharacterized protein n=1 Tax=Oryza punctata TaxID=4537 RepID=A0A0E0LQT1_ORYPU